MIKTSCFGFILFLLVTTVNAQTTLNGKVFANSEVEGIHVINKTLKQATVTKEDGSFIVNANLNDTIVFSGVIYKLHSIVIDSNIIATQQLNVVLVEHINQLNEVVVGNTLTGDLLSDVNNSKAQPDINFYDVGIPGYKGKPLTQSERRLKEAGELKLSDVALGALTGAIPLNPILNGITGRTKMLKERVKLEATEELMYNMMALHSTDLFKEQPLEESLRFEFFYFCSEDPSFFETCSQSNGIETLQFLQEKLKQYINQRKN